MDAAIVNSSEIIEKRVPAGPKTQNAHPSVEKSQWVGIVCR